MYMGSERGFAVRENVYCGTYGQGKGAVLEDRGKSGNPGNNHI
jgi:hypothetical protein